MPLYIWGRSYATASWLPTSAIGTLLWWHKADAGTDTTTNGTNVSSWSDQSSNGRTLSQSTAANQFIYTTGVLNGLPGLNSVNSTNLTRMTTASFTQNQPFIECILIKTTAAFSAGTTTGTIFGDATESGSRAIFRDANNGAPLIYAGGSVSWSGSLSASTGYYMTGVFDNSYATGSPGSGGAIRVNGSEVQGVILAAGCAGGIEVGSLDGTTNNPQCYYIEHFGISGSNSTDITNAEAYLKSRGGL